jgi:GAF domain-containing protein
MEQTTSAIAADQEPHNEKRLRQTLVDAAVRFNSIFDVTELLRSVREISVTLLQAEAASVQLLDEENQEFVSESQTRASSRQGIAGWVLQEQKPASISNASADPRFHEAVDGAHAVTAHTLIAVPLSVQGRSIGVLEIVNRRSGGTFSAGDVEIAGALGDLAAVAINNARLYRKITDALVESRENFRL